MFRRFIPLTGVVLTILGVTVLFAVDRPARDEKPQPTVEQITGLLTRIEMLEKRVEVLEKRQSVTVMRPQTSPVPPSLRVPDDWGKREFNGRPYYIVPLTTPARP